MPTEKAVATIVEAWARKEATPGERGATWRWRDAVLTQDSANGAGRHLDAELAELAVDAQIAPSRVLPGQLGAPAPSTR